jgi:hypothetical protein
LPAPLYRATLPVFRVATIDAVLCRNVWPPAMPEGTFKAPVHLQVRRAAEYICINITRKEVSKVPGRAEVQRFFNYLYEAVEEVFVVPQMEPLKVIHNMNQSCTAAGRHGSEKETSSQNQTEHKNSDFIWL